jgi:hypothetical protein
VRDSIDLIHAFACGAAFGILVTGFGFAVLQLWQATALL